MNTYKPNEFAEMIGVSVKTLQRWDNENKLKAFRTPTDRRYYTHSQYVEYIGNNKHLVTFECDNMAQKENLIKYAESINCKKVGD